APMRLERVQLVAEIQDDRAPSIALAESRDGWRGRLLPDRNLCRLAGSLQPQRVPDDGARRVGANRPGLDCQIGTVRDYVSRTLVGCQRDRGQECQSGETHTADYDARHQRTV